MSIGTQATSAIPKRKVYFASALTQKQVLAEFGTILDWYRQVEAPEDAEFVILDLDHPPVNALDHVKSRSCPGEKIRREALVPCLVICKNPVPASAKVLFVRDEIERVFSKVRIAATPIELLDDLQWLERMIPYTKESAEEQKMRSRAIDYVLMSRSLGSD